MANRINFQIGFQVDKTTLNEIKTSLQSLSSVKVSNVMNLNKSLGLQEARVQTQLLHSTIKEIGTALDKSFNNNLGILNITKFQQELSKTGLNLNTIQQRLSVAGATGNMAFRNMATSMLTTNMRIKESSKLLDSLAISMKNTIKWSITSSALNKFTGSIQQAYGYVKNLDSSLNDIRIVTSKSAEEMENFAVKANKAASALGKSTTDYTKASLIYYQQGKCFIMILLEK